MSNPNRTWNSHVQSQVDLFTDLQKLMEKHDVVAIQLDHKTLTFHTNSSYHDLDVDDDVCVTPKIVEDAIISIQCI